MLSCADDIEGVSLAVSGVHDYKSYFDTVGMSGGGIGPGNMSGGGESDGKSLEDMFYQKEDGYSQIGFYQTIHPRRDLRMGEVERAGKYNIS